MGFPGRFHASSAPTVAKAATNTNASDSVRRAPELTGQLRGQRMKDGIAAVVVVTATETAQTDHARQNAAGAMCLTTATLRPDRSGNVTAQD